MKKITAESYLKMIDGRIMQRKTEIDFLIKILDKVKPKRALEIGTCGGGVTTLLGMYADGVVTVDISRSLEYVYSDFKDIKNKVTQIIGDSNDKNTQLKVNGNYDLVVIDGGHDWKTGYTDWQFYSPLAPVVLIHDIDGYEHKHGFGPCGNHWDWFPTEFWHFLKTGETDRNIEPIGSGFDMDELNDGNGSWGAVFKHE